MPATSPAVVSAEERAADLARMKRRATGLLVAVSVAFLLVVLATEDTGGWGYVRAALEAGMVGGLADWFAVVAIFRHPLELPIPHTAVIVERKDAFGETLGQFVQEYFLNTDTVTERVEAIGVTDRATSWVLADGNAERVSGYVAGVVVRLADVMADDEVLALAERELRERVERLDVAPFAGRLLAVATEDGRHRELVDSVLVGLDTFLGDNEALLRARFAEQAPWWSPEFVDSKIFERLLSGIREVLRGETLGGRDEVRARLDEAIERIGHRLRSDPVWHARAEQLTAELLDHPQLRAFLEGLWTDLKDALRDQAEDDGSVLRGRLSEMITTAVRRIRSDDALMAHADRLVLSAVAAVTDQFQDEIKGLVATTISRWDGDDTATRLELLLGRDLQFIRINGTIVGALAGTVIHAIGDVLG